MSKYESTNIPKNAFLALLDSKIDQTFVLDVATGQKIRINDLKNPVNAKVLEAGIRSGVYEVIERSYPRSFLLKNDNWELSGIDYTTKTALVTVQSPSGNRFLVCKLNSDRFSEPCRTIFCNSGGR